MVSIIYIYRINHIFLFRGGTRQGLVSQGVLVLRGWHHQHGVQFGDHYHHTDGKLINRPGKKEIKPQKEV